MKWRASARSAPAAAACLLAACADAASDRLSATLKPTYDQETGRLAALTSDANGNGRFDTWTEMDGTRPLRSLADRDEDGTLDRWEYYDANGRLVKVGLSRRHAGRPHRWERYERGVLETAAFDEDGDGPPDRRLTYNGSARISIESEPDAAGLFKVRRAAR